NICNGPQFVRIERRRRIKAKASAEIAYFATSRTREQASPERLLAPAREPWAIEPKLHSVRCERRACP
ncbi:MAG: hypothetical protein ACREQC_05115, partial [Candidatus Binataceae bacterium]